MSPTILIIEDTAANMKLATTLLRKSGYEVLQAEDATQGINLARNIPRRSTVHDDE